MIPTILNDTLLCFTIVTSGPYYILFKRGTYHPIKRILESSTDADARSSLQQWCRYKTREAGYVQVAGAVIFASIIGALSWPTITNYHWSGPALWYACIILAVCSILTGAQQTLLLGSGEIGREFTSSEIQHIKSSLVRWSSEPAELSALVVFCWQVPVMLLCYSILCFLAGLCSIVYSPLARELKWNAESKTASVFTIAAVVCLFSWATASLVAFRLRIPGQLMMDTKW